jgi:hypothetical protein
MTAMTRALPAIPITTSSRSPIRRSNRQQPPNPPPQVVDVNAARVQRRPILGGLINQYTQAA